MPEKKKLIMEITSSWDAAGPKQRQAFQAFATEYAEFLHHSRTERLATEYLKKLAEKDGFVPLERQKKWTPGARVYAVNHGKNIVLAVLGKRPIAEGFNLIASHLDAPRLDLKQRPLHQDDDLGLAVLRTHYYGGVKKYQWASIPLGLFGRAIRRDGSAVDIAIGLSPDDPCFVITDLLPHLSRREQAERKEPEVIKGEELLVLCGGIPAADKDAKQRVKQAVLELLNRDYGIEEEDLVSAEIEVVPVSPIRFAGFDRSFLAGYGQDDRICAYASARAVMDLKIPQRTAVAVCVDKEEIGSEGNTSMQSSFLANFAGDLLELGAPNYHEKALRRLLAASFALSADVFPAVEPNFKQVHELSNAARAGCGVVITKYTGHHGKAEASDAHAEMVGKVRKIFNDAGVPWQAAEFGKVDEGGGGTVAKFLAKLGMDVLDCGPGILSIHSPFELVSVADLSAARQAYRAFFEKA